MYYKKNAMLEGLGRVYRDDGLVLDGEFSEGSLNGHGFMYNCETNELYEARFSSNSCSKMIRKLEGFFSVPGSASANAIN